MKEDKGKLSSAASGIAQNDPILAIDDLHPPATPIPPRGALRQIAASSMSDSQRLILAIEASDKAEQDQRLGTDKDPIAERLGFSSSV